MALCDFAPVPFRSGGCAASSSEGKGRERIGMESVIDTSVVDFFLYLIYLYLIALDFPMSGFPVSDYPMLDFSNTEVFQSRCRLVRLLWPGLGAVQKAPVAAGSEVHRPSPPFCVWAKRKAADFFKICGLAGEQKRALSCLTTPCFCLIIQLF